MCNTSNLDDYRLFNFTEENPLTYFAGYLFKKCLEIHKCQHCTDSIQSVPRSTNLLSLYKAYNNKNSTFGSLIVPPIMFTDYIKNLENKFQAIFKGISNKQSVGVMIYEDLKKFHHAFNVACINFPIDYLLRFFIRIRIYFTLKFINNDFKTVKHPRKLKNLQHI